jgi:hypothetical protein
MIKLIRQFGSLKEFQIECNECGETETYEVTSWHDMINAKKVDGWTFRKVEGDKFEDLCPECEGL